MTVAIDELGDALAAYSDVVKLHVPERGLLPLEPEDPYLRPCSCAACRRAPHCAQPQKQHGHVLPTLEAALATFAGVYPRGFGALALAELERSAVIITDHLIDHCVVLFQQTAHATSDIVGKLELTTFELIFELVGSPVTLPPAPVIADIAAASETQARAAVADWRTHLRRYKRWRVSVHRNQLVNRYKAPEVVPVIADALAAIGAISIAVGCTAGPEVDLANYEVEVVAYFSDGADKLKAAADTNGRAALMGRPELLFLGVQSDATRCRPVTMHVAKGAIRSRADDTVSFCVAHRALDHLIADGAGAVDGRASPINVLDPMCGVGTYLLAFRWLLAHRPLPPGRFGAVHLTGVDSDSEAVRFFTDNAAAGAAARGAPLTAMIGSSIRLPLRDASVDLVLVDPPWGMRHQTHAYVKHYFPRWAREWARVLRPGGVAIVVTICKKVFEEQVMSPLVRKGLLVLESATQFDNKGWTVCRLYVVRKPLIPVCSGLDGPSGGGGCGGNVEGPAVAISKGSTAGEAKDGAANCASVGTKLVATTVAEPPAECGVHSGASASSSKTGGVRTTEDPSFVGVDAKLTSPTMPAQPEATPS
eukprot:TRINITY_DN34465_c0_g1_i1.p1 TRINITY_DN34465_c0_g1~~TRINITY_DN34465_c0_g1_i1.p1  ORF type:complete len:617 (+),score=90.41 TRINITY_DN34465_c0_g1_i1:77-1852(+)